VAAALLAGASGVHARVTTAEQACQAGRANAAAKYQSCALKALAAVDFLKVTTPSSGQDLRGYNKAIGKCVTQYVAAWPKLRKKAKGTGSTCDSPRFVDNGDGTITDMLTALQWEKKDNYDRVPNYADPHDADNYYYWNGNTDQGVSANSTVFTKFLASLNSAGGCFVGECDWRIPTRDELATIGRPGCPRPLGVPNPCTGCTSPTGGPNPCIDPTFGPTISTRYFSDTTFPTVPNDAWFVDFAGFGVAADEKSDAPERAVRGGL
jgi:hypothetical protein